MLAAIERGRPPAIDFLNGEVVARGATLGVPTPVNAAMREEVLAIARGASRPSLQLLRAFYERTRAPAEAMPVPATEVPMPVDPLAGAASPPVEPPSVEPPSVEPPAGDPPPDVPEVRPETP
jgi:2-dehydropantoate 2-reductase